MQEILNKLSFDYIIKYVSDNIYRIIFVIVFIAFYIPIYRIVLKAIEIILLKRISNPGLKSFIKSLFKALINIFMLFFIFDLIGLNMQNLFAILGALSVVVGFSFKEIIQNIFGGLMILIFKPFVVDDVIEFQNYVGVVHKIEMFYTKLLNFQNELIVIPNGMLIVNEIRNITTKNKRRLDLIIGVSYSSNLDKVKKVLENIVKECEFVLDENPIIGVTELAASSINFATFVYVEPQNYAKAKFYLLENIKKRFDEEGIEIPFNQLVVSVKGDK